MPKKKRHRAAKDLAKKIYQAVKLVPEDGSGLSKHAGWDVGQLIKVVGPDDLNPFETMALAAILASANERRLRVLNGGPGTGRVPELANLLPILRAV